MSMDKAIALGKEHRKPYRGFKFIDCSCRNHGSCSWCLANRKHKFRDKQSLIDIMTKDEFEDNMWDREE